MKKLRQVALVVGSMVVLGASATWVLLIQPAKHRFRQVGVFTDLVAYTNSLHEYHEQHGSYPLKLEEATGEIEWFSPSDRWGTPLVYLSSGDSFVLISMGLGGRPDGDNYLAARMQAPRRRAPGECSDPRVDQVVTDQGWYRECGK